MWPNQKQEDRDVLPKPNLIVYIGRSLEGPKSAKKAPDLVELKTKRQGYTSETKIDSLHQQVPKMFFEPDPNIKNSPNRQKIAPKCSKCGRIKNNRNSSEEFKKHKKGSNCGQIKNKKMRLQFHTISHAIQVFFNVCFLGFVDAPAMCILDTFIFQKVSLWYQLTSGVF